MCSVFLSEPYKWMYVLSHVHITGHLTQQNVECRMLLANFWSKICHSCCTCDARHHCSCIPLSWAWTFTDGRKVSGKQILLVPHTLWVNRGNIFSSSSSAFQARSLGSSFLLRFLHIYVIVFFFHPTIEVVTFLLCA